MNNLDWCSGRIKIIVILQLLVMHHLSAMAISTRTHRLRARNSTKFNLPSLWAVPSAAVRSSSQSLLERVSRYFTKQCGATTRCPAIPSIRIGGRSLVIKVRRRAGEKGKNKTGTTLYHTCCSALYQGFVYRFASGARGVVK
jgi:hypothetical protein